MLESQNQREPTLKELRESLKLSQEDLGRRINLSYRTIAEWEGGRKVPRFDNAIALARELGIPLKDLAKSLRLEVEGLIDDVPIERSQPKDDP
ncbi:MAG TPA: XRE family transcriptional regulator [Cyanobacteria bacterium UBA11372]|nr:XRE family transcriptional regulator [Cyanobacteria bacterium UBA11372]